MKTLLASLTPKRVGARFAWAPAVTMTSGWMVCTLNPYGTLS
jgi:hypothetical protein